MGTLVYGIDPSLHRTGIAALRSEPDREYQFWSSTSIGSRPVGDAIGDLVNRYRTLTAAVTGEMTKWSDDWPDPDLIVMEGPAYGSGKTRSPVMDHRISGFWWAMAESLCGWAGQFVKPPQLLIVPPTTLKQYITGKGGAGKDEVLLAVSRLYSGCHIANNDEADAVGLTALGTRFLGGQAEQRVLPQKNLAALKKLVAETL